MLVEWSNCRCVRMEDLAPVRTCLERSQNLLYLGDRLLNRLGFALPGKVDGDGVFLIGHAHPQPIGGHTANLAYQEDCSELVCQDTHSFYSCQGMATWEEVLRLNFFAVAGCVA